MSKISVIVPIYNVEKYLHRCIDSILAQTFIDFDLVLVDDGSPDNCGKICDEYADKDSRIHVIHKENGGLSEARNEGIASAFTNSDSEWITFIDSDDWVHPKYLEALYNAVVSTGLNISVCGFEPTDGDDPIVDEDKLTYEILSTEQLFCTKNSNTVIAVCKLYRKEDFKEIRYPVGKLHEDEFTTYKILFKYETLAYINQPLYFYYQNTASIMKSDWSPKRLIAFSALQEQLDYFSQHGLSDAYIRVMHNIAYTYVDQITSINNSHVKQSNARLLRRRLAAHLKRNKKVAGFSVDSTPLFYDTAYPNFMKVYWIVRAQIKKIERKKHA